MFHKKFQVRITLFTDDAYQVEYAYYRVLKLWHVIKHFEAAYAGPILEDFNTLIFLDFESALRFAKKLETYGDVKLHYAKEHRKRDAEYAQMANKAALFAEKANYRVR